MDILDDTPTQLQQQTIGQSDFLDKPTDPVKQDSSYISSKQDLDFLSSKREPDFLSSKQDTRSTDFFSFSAAEKQKQKAARAQISPEVKYE